MRTIANIIAFNYMSKSFKGDRYIYYLMAYYLCKAERDKGNSSALTRIGEDNGMVGGFNYYRSFTLHEYEGRTILTEHKNAKSFASFSRIVEIIHPEMKRPLIMPYINEAGEDCFKRWVH